MALVFSQYILGPRKLDGYLGNQDVPVALSPISDNCLEMVT